LKLEELKDNIKKLESLKKSKHEFEVCISEIKNDDEVTYLPLGNYWCYVDSDKLKSVLQTEIDMKDYEITNLKQLIGVE